MSSTRVIPFAPEAGDNAAAVQRHRVAWRQAARRAKVSDSVKYGSIFIAGVIFVVALLINQASRSERFGFPVISASLVAGAAVVVFATHLWSMILHVRARRLKIAMDAAVNSSPSLSTPQRAELMSPPPDAVTPASGRKRAA